MGVQYDNWFRERSLYEPGVGGKSLYETALAKLKQDGYMVEKEGAVWFASSELGEDKDNVVIRSTGRPTYFASDIAYHFEKFQRRGFERVINVWGADHQGHVSRLKMAVQALGVDASQLEILIYQLVSFRRGEELVRLSKRSGNIVLIRDIIDEVGPDACRFFFLSRSSDSQMEFDLELAKRQSAENPVYYVQYAHARIAGIIANAAERNISSRGRGRISPDASGRAGAGAPHVAATRTGAAHRRAFGAAPPARTTHRSWRRRTTSSTPSAASSTTNSPRSRRPASACASRHASRSREA